MATTAMKRIAGELGRAAGIRPPAEWLVHWGLEMDDEGDVCKRWWREQS
jgi:hypothetical protein